MPDTDEPRLAPGVVRSRALSGLKALAMRTFASQGLRVISSLTLARLLYPGDYGVFGVVAYLTGLGMFLGDVGLSSALVRQHREPDEDETLTVFIGQQILTGLVVLTLLIAAPLLVHAYKLSGNAVLLLRVMACGLFFASLRIVPMMVLERELQFGRIARCEFLENLVLTVGTIFLAWRGCGAWAFAGGGLLRSATGLIAVWLASPYRPRGRFRLSIVKRLMGFGVAFQLNALVPTILSGWLPLFGARLLGTISLGLINWAINLASIPMMLSTILNRVAFPAYSRLHAEPEAFASALIASIRRISAIFWLLIPAAIIVCPPALPLVFSHRWLPAVPLVQWLCWESVVQVLIGLLASAQNASGRASERLGVTIGMGLARCGIGYLALTRIGLAGIPPALCIVSLGELALTLFLLSRRNPACRILAAEALTPLAAATLLLVLALWAGQACTPHPGWVRSVLSLVVFLGLTSVRDLSLNGRATARELMALGRMLGSRSNESA